MERISPAHARAVTRAVGQSITRLDPQSAVALVASADWIQHAEAALREAGIQLSTPGLHQTATAIALRDRIDDLLGIVPRPQPVNQRDED
ncbi:MAG TPA: hypothetical protein VL251_03820 [Thermomonas sp.]|nr:hypothetical protein [Thermomonas sp.]